MFGFCEVVTIVWCGIVGIALDLTLVVDDDACLFLEEISNMKMQQHDSLTLDLDEVRLAVGTLFITSLTLTSWSMQRRRQRV
jgi:hypothetical protein